MTIENEIACPNEGCEGIIELATKVYFDIGGELQDLPGRDGPTVVINELEPSDVNDSVNGLAFNMEAELTVSCADCGDEFEVAWGDGFKRDFQADRYR